MFSYKHTETTCRRFRITRNFYKQLFYKQHQTETEKKKQAKVKQHHEAELLLFKKYSHSSSMLSLKNKYSQKASMPVLVKLYD